MRLPCAPMRRAPALFLSVSLGTLLVLFAVEALSRTALLVLPSRLAPGSLAVLGVPLGLALLGSWRGRRHRPTQAGLTEGRALLGLGILLGALVLAGDRVLAPVPGGLVGTAATLLLLVVPGLVLASLLTRALDRELVAVADAPKAGAALAAGLGVGGAIAVAALPTVLPLLGLRRFSMITAAACVAWGGWRSLRREAPRESAAESAPLGSLTEPRGLMVAAVLLGAALMAIPAASWPHLVAGLGGALGARLALLPWFAGILAGAWVGGWIARRLDRPDRFVLWALGFGAALFLALEAALDPLVMMWLREQAAGVSRAQALLADAPLRFALPAACLGAALPAWLAARSTFTGTPRREGARLLAGLGFGATLAGGICLLVPAGSGGLWTARTAILTLVVTGAALLRLVSPEGRRWIASLALAGLGGLALWAAVADDRGVDADDPLLWRMLDKPLSRALVYDRVDDVRVLGRDVHGVTRSRLADTTLPAPARGGPLHAVDRGALGVEVVQSGRRLGHLESREGLAPDRAGAALGLVPAAYHPAPRRALMVGLGTGATLRGLRAAGIEAIDVVDTHPTGLALLPTRDPSLAGVHLERQLPRPFLARADARWDLILVEGTQPEDAAFWSTLTVEGLEAVHAGLRPGGCAGVRLSIETFTPALLRRLIATWTTVFPESIALGFADQLVLVGTTSSPGPLPERLGAWAATGAPRPRALLRRLGVESAASIWAHLLADAAGLVKVQGDAEPIRDGDVAAERDAAAQRVDPYRREQGIRAFQGAFPPAFEKLVPDGEARSRLLSAIIDVWRERDPTVATYWLAGIEGRAALRFGSALDALLAKARLEERRRRWTQAARLYKLAASRFPADDARHTRLLVAHLQALTGGAAAETAPNTMAWARMAEDVGRLTEAYRQHGPVLAAAGELLRTLRHFTAARDTLRAARAATEPPPPGTDAALARVLLILDPMGQRTAAAKLFAGDPTTFEDPDLLELYLDAVDLVGHEEAFETLGAAQATLFETEAQQALQRAQASLREGNLREARLAAEEAVKARPGLAAGYRLGALATLLAAAATEDPEGALGRVASTVRGQLRSAIRNAKDSGAARARAERLMRMFGLEPELAEPPTQPGETR